MSIVELIERKRDGGVLAPDEIAWVIAEYSADEIPDYQMSAWLMAVSSGSWCCAAIRTWPVRCG